MSVVKLIVVGDIFKNSIHEVEGIIIESDAIEYILEYNNGDTVELLIQQGVNLLALTRAVQQRNASGLSGNIVIRSHTEMPRAVHRLAHKSKVENICVSYPKKTGDTHFELDLQFSSQNEFFLDHMTGFHIQGMALSEAARQAFLVVTEEFFLKGSNQKWYFVIKHQSASFENFVFPLSAVLKYEIRDHKVKAGRHTFEVEMAIYQGETRCCTFDVGFTTFEAGLISEREASMLKERAEEVLAMPRAIDEVFVSTQPTRESAPAAVLA